ncbi:hypothetical protein PanWU01x14_252670 [Parasponia andersonii]|uniref:Uncharacterized protein n=1 Tax=Parasponia andersonii TaxID=3476 RepID=A0A2P5BBT3_PARAD|nr:hypothetical protein PanWU01x14_252670 [Parasponia andersonii]
MKDPPFNLPPSDYVNDPNRRVKLKQVALFREGKPLRTVICLGIVKSIQSSWPNQFYSIIAYHCVWNQSGLTD